MFKLLTARMRRFLGERGGNISIVAALSLPVILGAFGIGAEAASWMAGKRAMQNAADAAAIAAATNAGASYGIEARAVSAQYGFRDGVAATSVTAKNAVPCPDGGSNCYSVTVSKTVPLLLAQIVGYQGNARLNNSPAMTISAVAVAVQATSPRPYCVVALATSGGNAGIRTNGAPKADLSGCNVMSNGDATCNGHNLSADHGDAHGSNDGCGVVHTSNAPKVADPYAGLAKNIPPDPCNGAYHPIPTKKNGADALPPINTGVGWHGVVQICGDAQLPGDLTLTQDTTIVIYNGQLDTNGHTLKTAADVGATVVFSGSNGVSSTHAPTGGGTLDIAAPTSGPWSGMALYQDPALTSGVDISAAGNSPTWDITGVAYFPHASVTFSGAVNKSSNGYSCFNLIVDDLLINGTGSILAHGECAKAGVTQPTGQAASRGKLVS